MSTSSSSDGPHPGPSPSDAWEVTLRDGAKLRIRPVGPDDAGALEEGFSRLSAESRFMRFFSAVPRLSPAQLKYFTDIDQHHHVALAAFDPEVASPVDNVADGLGVGVARYIATADAPTVAEFAVAVVDDYQGRGVGTALLDALTEWATAAGITKFKADLLAQNRRMVAVFRNLGWELSADPTDPTMLTATLDLPVAHLHRQSGLRSVMRHMARRRPPAHPDRSTDPATDA